MRIPTLRYARTGHRKREVAPGHGLEARYDIGESGGRGTTPSRIVACGICPVFHPRADSVSGRPRIEEYRDLFEAAYPGTEFGDMTFVHASNAIMSLHYLGVLVRRFPLGSLPARRQRPPDRPATAGRYRLHDGGLHQLPPDRHPGCTARQRVPQRRAGAVGPGQGDGPGRAATTSDVSASRATRTTDAASRCLRGATSN